jgi:hypothetical protein
MDISRHPKNAGRFCTILLVPADATVQSSRAGRRGIYLRRWMTSCWRAQPPHHTDHTGRTGRGRTRARLHEPIDFGWAVLSHITYPRRTSGQHRCTRGEAAMDAEERSCRGSPYAVCTVLYILSALSTIRPISTLRRPTPPSRCKARARVTSWNCADRPTTALVPFHSTPTVPESCWPG